MILCSNGIDTEFISHEITALVEICLSPETDKETKRELRKELKEIHLDILKTIAINQ